MNADPTEVLSIYGDVSAKVSRIEYKGETGLWLKSMAPYLLVNLLLAIAANLLFLNSEPPSESIPSIQSSQEL